MCTQPCRTKRFVFYLKVRGTCGVSPIIGFYYSFFRRPACRGRPENFCADFFWPGRCLRLRFPKSESSMACADRRRCENQHAAKGVQPDFNRFWCCRSRRSPPWAPPKHRPADRRRQRPSAPQTTHSCCSGAGPAAEFSGEVRSKSRPSRRRARFVAALG